MQRGTKPKEQSFGSAEQSVGFRIKETNMVSSSLNKHWPHAALKFCASLFVCVLEWRPFAWACSAVLTLGPCFRLQQIYVSQAAQWAAPQLECSQDFSCSQTYFSHTFLWGLSLCNYWQDIEHGELHAPNDISLGWFSAQPLPNFGLTPITFDFSGCMAYEFCTIWMSFQGANHQKNNNTSIVV